VHAIFIAEFLLENLKLSVNNDFLQRANNHVKVVILFVFTL
jgi:hypothetical protein